MEQVDCLKDCLPKCTCTKTGSPVPCDTQRLINMPGPETKIETAACKYADSLGVLNRKLKYIGRRGAPDRMFLPKGKPVFFIEFKRPGGSFQPGQEIEIAKLRARGYKVFVCDNLDEAKQIIKENGL